MLNNMLFNHLIVSLLEGLLCGSQYGLIKLFYAL